MSTRKRPPETIAAGEFKAKCLQLMDAVAETRQPVVITKRGRPVAKLVPIEAEKPTTLFGFMKGELEILDDSLAPVDVEWDALE